MSWSVSAVGRPKAVAEKIKRDIAAVTCSEPEDTIKNAISCVIATALEAYPDSHAVSVSASGSQGPSYDPGKPGSPTGQLNNLHVSITPLYGFVS